MTCCDCGRRLADEMERNRYLQQRCHEQEMLAQRQVEIVKQLVNQVKRQRLEEELFDKLSLSNQACHSLAGVLLGDDDRDIGVLGMLRDLHGEYLDRIVARDKRRTGKRKAKR